MWEIDWASPPERLPGTPGGASALDPEAIRQAYLLFWMEHCIECAVPECYSVCSLYVPRRDRKCARFRYGIWPNPAFRGLYDFGADVHFRRWGKLESKLCYGGAAPRTLRELAARDRRALRLIQPIAGVLEPLNPKRRLNGAYTLLRERALSAEVRSAESAAAGYDAFVAEVFNPGREPVNLIVEAHQDQLRFREVLPLEPGPNLHRVPYRSFGVDLGRREGRLLVYPENDAEVRLIFTWLDFVKYREAPVARASAVPVSAPPKPAAKVKCVAWDLDHTLWKGILIEDGPEALTPNPAALELVRALDERGILQTVVSKNDHAQAWAVVERMGLGEYFLSPAIGWGRKSASLRQVAADLNIDVDTFALIDDSAFERGEVAHELPQVRTYADHEIPTLLARTEFDVPVSEESRLRRLSYLAEGRRRSVAQSAGDDYDGFLRSCGMRLELFRPVEPRHQDRCLELLQRSNQLNLSTRRYERAEFLQLLDDPEVSSLAMACRDQFGDYGTVGFVSVAQVPGRPPVLRDLVLSCRVAKKRVESALFHWLGSRLRALGHDRLHATFIPTARNGVLLDALSEVGFMPLEEGEGPRLLELPFDRDVPGGTVVEVDARDIAFPAPTGAGMETPTGAG